MSTFGALDFVPAFQAFLNKHKPDLRIPASIFDCLNVYKSIAVLLPNIPHISDKSRLSKLRACCAIPSHSLRKPDTPAHFDTALIIQDNILQREMGGLHGWSYRYLSKFKLTCSLFAGLRAAQIHVIFTLPPQYGTFSHPLAYIEWFQPFTTIDENIGMYKVVRSTRNRAWHSAIVSVNEILQACHLAPKYGPAPVDHLDTLERA